MHMKDRDSQNSVRPHHQRSYPYFPVVLKIHRVLHRMKRVLSSYHEVTLFRCRLKLCLLHV